RRRSSRRTPAGWRSARARRDAVAWAPPHHPPVDSSLEERGARASHAPPPVGLTTTARRVQRERRRSTCGTADAVRIKSEYDALPPSLLRDLRRLVFPGAVATVRAAGLSSSTSCLVPTGNGGTPAPCRRPPD